MTKQSTSVRVSTSWLARAVAQALPSDLGFGYSKNTSCISRTMGEVVQILSVNTGGWLAAAGGFVVDLVVSSPSMYELYYDASWPAKLSKVVGPISWRLRGTASDSGGIWPKRTIEDAQSSVQALTQCLIANGDPLLAGLGSEREILEALRQGQPLPTGGMYGTERLRAILEAIHGDSLLALELMNDVLKDAVASSATEHLVPGLTRLREGIASVSARNLAQRL
jgi:hypothetical protein